MNRIISHILILLMLCMASLSSVYAGEVVIANTFTAGTPAVASEVNGNFSAVKTAVDDNDGRIAALEAALATLQATVAIQAATIADLEEDLAAVQTSDVMALEPYLSVDEDAETSGARVMLTRVNLQVVNGLSGTASINGYGNVVIGYNEVNTWDFKRCSDGLYTNQVDCESAGEIWGITHKSGSHNLVLGSENSYSQYGGLVAGLRNFINRSYATISGGALNTAMGEFSSIMGGYVNTASGSYSCVSGGTANSASGEFSSVSGGHQSGAAGESSSVSGGNYNWAAGDYASVSGGRSNHADGQESSVNGGYDNTASGIRSAVNGGSVNESSGENSSVNGGFTNIASGIGATVSGGANGNAPGYRSTVGGGNETEATGSYDWAAGTLHEDD